MKIFTKDRLRTIGRILFVIYIILLIYMLFFAESYGRRPEIPEKNRWNIRPFQEILRYWRYRDALGILSFLNIGGNILGFMPFGFFLPVVHSKLQKAAVTVSAGFALSLTVELIQLVSCVGRFDVDDIILNTLGCILGYLCFLLCNRIRHKFAH